MHSWLISLYRHKRMVVWGKILLKLIVLVLGFLHVQEPDLTFLEVIFFLE